MGELGRRNSLGGEDTGAGVGDEFTLLSTNTLSFRCLSSREVSNFSISEGGNRAERAETSVPGLLGVSENGRGGGGSLSLKVKSFEALGLLGVPSDVVSGVGGGRIPLRHGTDPRSHIRGGLGVLGEDGRANGTLDTGVLDEDDAVAARALESGLMGTPLSDLLASTADSILSDEGEETGDGLADRGGLLDFFPSEVLEAELDVLPGVSAVGEGGRGGIGASDFLVCGTDRGAVGGSGGGGGPGTFLVDPFGLVEGGVRSVFEAGSGSGPAEEINLLPGLV